MNTNLSARLLVLLASTLAFTACGSEETAGPTTEGEVAVGEEVPELGKALLDPVEESTGKADRTEGNRGLPVSVDRSNTAVWEIKNQWADKDTPEALLAGMAWPANSGLDWDQKYTLWVRSLGKIDGHSHGKTFELTTPYGKTLPGPALECAEQSIFLRATFASWYNLPFFMEARDANGKRVYLGHFGFRTDDGVYRSMPNFKTKYRDYSDQADTWATAGWPTDSGLRKRKLGGSQDDWQPFLSDEARAGAYFDEIYLNKRVGYFMIVVLSYFGSINLADNNNMYHVTPESIREGDTVLKRYRRRGIGHTLVVKTVNEHEGFFEVEVVSGSMPRRQAVWESAASSKHYFGSDSTGGPGENSDGHAYASLGGGLRRWRTAVNSNGRWANIVPVADQANWINARDLEAVAARIATFGRILREVPPEEKRKVLLERIEAARDHLRRYPASCAARERREEAFEELYTFEADETDSSRTEVDARYRTLEDFVFAKLVYDESKTCCWNSTDSNMYEIIMARAEQEMMDHTAGECRVPSVFKAVNGGYAEYKAFAESIGRGDQWVEWSEDESCPQADTMEDVEAPLAGADWCDVGDLILSGGAELGADDAYEPNNSVEDAAELEFGVHSDLKLCDGEDFYAFEMTEADTLAIKVQFNSERGDIDVQLLDEDGDELESSTGSNDVEEMEFSAEPGKYVLRVYAFNDTEGQCQRYDVAAGVGEAPASRE